jgi:hypothetical protein
MHGKWQEPWGDRRQELVFIGIGLDPAALTERLDAALLDVDKFAPKSWASLPDPFPSWRQAAA